MKETRGLSPALSKGEGGRLMRLLVLLFAFVLATVSLTAQEEETYSDEDTASVITKDVYKQNPGWYLRNIDSAKIPTGILIDRVKFKNDMGLFNGKSRVKTCDYAVFRRVVKHLQKAANDSVYFPNLDSVYEFAYHKMRWEQIYPIAIMNYSYNKVRKKAFLSKLAELTDTAMTLTSGYDSIFATRRCFLASPFNIRMHGDNIQVAFYRNMFFTNSNDSVIKIEANFGNGWKTFDWDEPQSISFGTKTQYVEAKVRLTYMKNGETKQRKVISHFTVLRTGSDLVPNILDNTGSKLKSTTVKPDKTIYYPEDKITQDFVCTKWSGDGPTPATKKFTVKSYPVCIGGIYTNNYSQCAIEASILFAPSNNSGKLRKPLILCDGFDPGDKRDFNQTYIKNLDETLEFSRDTRGIYELVNGDPSPWYNSDKFPAYKSSSAGLVSTLQASNYDLVIVNFLNGAGDINYNAEAFAGFLTSVINSRTYRDNETEENVVIGPSMGGLITRLALTKLEKAGTSHYVREWFSFDSPQQGAYIPVDLQIGALYFDNLLKGLGKDHTATSEALEKLNTSAAKQMLIKHYSTINSDYIGKCDEANTIYESTLTGAGFPQLTRNIAITNGGTQKLFENDKIESLRIYQEVSVPKSVYDIAKDFYADNLGNIAADITFAIPDYTFGALKKIFSFFGVSRPENIVTLKVSTRGNRFRDGNQEVFWANDEIVAIDGARYSFANQIPYDNAPGGWNSALYDFNQVAANEKKPDFINNLHTRWATFMVTSSALGVKPDATNIHYTWKDYQDNPTLRAKIPFDDFYGPTGVCEEHVRISKSTGDEVMSYLGVRDLTDIQRPRLLNRTSNAQSVSGPVKLKGTTSVTLGGGSNYTFTMNTTADVNIAAGSKIVFKPGAKAVKGAKLKARVGATAIQKSAQVNNTPKSVTYAVTSPYIGKVASYTDDAEVQTEVVPLFLSEKAVSIFPNPTDGIINIEITGQGLDKVTISVANTMGKHVYSAPINSAYQQVDLTSLPAGLYFISVNLDGKMYRE
ncbi:MAG TPA: T9SS type A sorting domain-containing protein, partial [Bacteroidales bacterium]